MICGGLLAFAVVSPSIAGERYVEVWNPPEARGVVGIRPVQTARNTPPHRRTAAHVPHHRLRRHVVATAPVPAISRRSTASQTSRPALTFDDIPRQITPEGNVLRVNDRQPRVEVER
ncbi:hypothetical protein [Paraburkholderia piptadeniae]|uniref:hypothetical protein n=1 Tax=Paraburkholderia piptadeniae TaxID=1701573 RepID=UPI000B40472B|nr:hypothetical protein [Paraburkholderia piptadeniae]